MTVLAARMGPRQVAKMAEMERMQVMRSRRQSGQLRGSLGSSEGWGTRRMPFSNLRFLVASVASAEMRLCWGSSKYREVPVVLNISGVF